MGQSSVLSYRFTTSTVDVQPDAFFLLNWNGHDSGVAVEVDSSQVYVFESGTYSVRVAVTSAAAKQVSVWVNDIADAPGGTFSSGAGTLTGEMVLHLDAGDSLGLRNTGSGAVALTGPGGSYDPVGASMIIERVG
jgi:hypothetical protein